MTDEELDALQGWNDANRSRKGWGSRNPELVALYFDALIAEVKRLRFFEGSNPPLSMLINMIDAYCEANGLDYDLVTKRKTALVRPDGGRL